MSRASGRSKRVLVSSVEQLLDRLTTRDWLILLTLNKVRLASALQLERLHFYELTGHSRSVQRSHALRRLVDAGVLVQFEWQPGVPNRGLTQQCYALDAIGSQLVQLHFNREMPDARVRRPRVPGDRFVRHGLAVTERYVELVERARDETFTLVEFQVEGDAYWPDGLGGSIKPDAFVHLQQGRANSYWWFEADMATESMPTIRRKLAAYLDFLLRGQLGPHEWVPWVLVGVPNMKRREAVQAVVDELPDPADQIFRIAELSAAARMMIDVMVSAQEVI